MYFVTSHFICFGVEQGSVPGTISNLVTLTELNMSYNFGVSGGLPLEVGSMASLSVLHLYSAGINGESDDGTLWASRVSGHVYTFPKCFEVLL